MTIRPYAPQDRQKLCDLFAELIENHKEYISHGELQMGIATDRGELAPDFRNAWLRYLDRQTADPETEIMLAEQDGTPTGFVIYGINRDGAAPYGMIYDVGLLPRHRSRGTGSLLVQTTLDALREKGASSKNSGRGYERKYETYEIPVPSVKESAREQHITGLVTLVLIVRLQLRPKNAGYLPEAEFFEKTVGEIGRAHV